MSEQNIITQLAEKYLSEVGQEAVEMLLLENKIDHAKYYILGAVDSMWQKKQIDDAEATEAYRVLGVDPEKASTLRQSSLCWQ